MKAWIIVREYQKRGLPHAHCIFWLDDQNMLNGPEDIDRFIRADIPDPVTEPRLHALVIKYMMHGPCTSNRSCMQKDGVKCSKGYPKPFSEKTELIPGKFPQYKRPDNGRFVMVNGVMLTNQHVVPYNPLLLLTFDCHINVEWCASLFAIAYIMKYICKGNDRVALEMETPVEPNNPVVNNMLVTLADEVPMFEQDIMDDNINDDEGMDQEQVNQAEDNQTEIQEEFNQTDQIDHDEQVDIPNFIDDLPANDEPVITTVPDNFNRGPNFKAYDEIKRYESISFFDIYHS